jgi:hypothetical protein
MSYDDVFQIVFIILLIRAQAPHMQHILASMNKLPKRTTRINPTTPAAIHSHSGNQEIEKFSSHDSDVTRNRIENKISTI